MVPFLLNLVTELNIYFKQNGIKPAGDCKRQSRRTFTMKRTTQICSALSELKGFMIVNGVPSKPRQKLMRNLRIIDLLVHILKYPVEKNSDEPYLMQIFKATYDVLHTYMCGNSRKNALYFAKYINFFQTQFNLKSEVGLKVAQMIVELVRDNGKIVDRISKRQIQHFIDLLKKFKNYEYLDLLGVLCVCDGVAIPDNQVYITENWLQQPQSGVYMLEMGQMIERQQNVMYISTDSGSSWRPLHDFADDIHPEFKKEEFQFFEHQIDLFKKLCHGRNDFCIHVITKQQELLTWEYAFLCLQQQQLPYVIRTKICDVIIGLFIDVGINYSVLEHTRTSFIYEEINQGDFMSPETELPATDTGMRDLITVFPVLRDWISRYLGSLKGFIASQVGHNLLVEQVLKLLHYLVKFGYYSNLKDIQTLQKPLLTLLQGQNDKPFPDETRKASRSSLSKKERKEVSKETQRMINEFQDRGRFETSQENTAIVNAKYQALQVLELFLTYQFNSRLKSFVCLFKQAEQLKSRKHKNSALTALMFNNFDIHSSTRRKTREQHKIVKLLNEMFQGTAYFDQEEMKRVLMDLSHYKYDKLVTKSLSILNKYFSSKMDLFKYAVQTQILVTSESCKVHQQVSQHVPVIKRLAKSKLNAEQVQLMVQIMDTLTAYCHMPFDPSKPHTANQSILISHGVLSFLFDFLSQEIDAKLLDQYEGIRQVSAKTLQLLRALAKGNSYVQRRLYERLEALLKVRGIEGEVALTLTEAFVGNQTVCLKVQPKQVHRIVSLVGELQEKCPELLLLLQAIAKVQELDIPLKRNQAYVMKYMMHDYIKTAHFFEEPEAFRENILLGKDGSKRLEYLVALVDLLATCSEGENRFIESLCQTILPLGEILSVLTHPDVSLVVKKPYVKYLHWVYMHTATSVLDTGASELPHEESIWKFLNMLIVCIEDTIQYVSGENGYVEDLLVQTPHVTDSVGGTDPETQAQATLDLLLNTGLPFIKLFMSKFYSPDGDYFPEEQKITAKLSRIMMTLFEIIREHVFNTTHLKNMVGCITTLLPLSGISNNEADTFIKQMGSIEIMIKKEQSQIKEQLQIYEAESELNNKFTTFAVNSSLLFGGQNTVACQLKYANKALLDKEYTDIGGDESLPLGEEFQEHVRCFLKPQEKLLTRQFELTAKIVEQLSISACNVKWDEATRLEQEELDVKCLQILRAIVHNEIVKLPEDWEEELPKYRKQLERITAIQDNLNNMEAVVKVLPLLASSSDNIVKEVLAFMSIMLFNANINVQKSMIEYFTATREEVFFLALKNRMQLSIIALKERRALAAQKQARLREIMSQAKSLQSTMTVGRKALQDIQLFELRMRVSTSEKSRHTSLSTLQCSASRHSATVHKSQSEPEDHRDCCCLTCCSPMPSTKTKSPVKKRVSFNLANGIIKDREELMTDDDEIFEDIEIQQSPVPVVFTNSAFVGDTDEMDDILDYKDEGYIGLVIKVMARMCDGQFSPLQDYLREQPDNIKSFNLVAEAASFMNMVYSNITDRNIDLVIQLFSTLNEFASGNQANRMVIVSHKVVDYINFILRAGEFRNCSAEKILELRKIIGELLYSLIEENGPEPLAVAKEVKDSIDKDSLQRIMTNCYQMHQVKKPQLDDILQNNKFQGFKSALASAKSLAKEGTDYMKHVMDVKNKGMKETLTVVGFTYYFILARLQDIDPKKHVDETFSNVDMEKAYKYYKRNSTSIEILKADYLQKIHFRVKSKHVLREEVKDKLKWNVDRSSPSNKIRDLMKWSKDILNDIYYQRRVMSNWFTAFLTNNWLLWNRGAILLSLVINILMLITWKAKLAIEDVVITNNTEQLPADLFNDTPDITLPEFYRLAYILGGIHNLFSILVLVSYFLSNHPRMPNFKSIGYKMRKITAKLRFMLPCIRRSNDEAEEEPAPQSQSQLDVHFFSIKTFYYLAFAALSIAGTGYHGYFFAFHLLNIVNNNQLLKGVIQAVTGNGKSLLWVAVLGLVIFYLYSIVGFAWFRDVFRPDEQMFCASLLQCTITIIRYGLVGDYDEKFSRHDLTNNFTNFVFLAIFQVSFFIIISMIGLNIIFGIIVDTFSELRDLKWKAESDMRDTCFICSRKSYHFEHHGIGFGNHVKTEHNMWAYIFFFIHLDDIKSNDYTAMELYVHQLLTEERYDFFPMNRALSLATMNEDSTESKIDELLQYVMMLVRKQKQEESEKKRQQARQEQLQWEEQHKEIIERSRSVEDLTLDPDTERDQADLLSPLHLSPSRRMRDGSRRPSQDDVSPHSRRRMVEKQQSQWVATEYESTYL